MIHDTGAVIWAAASLALWIGAVVLLVCLGVIAARADRQAERALAERRAREAK